MNLKKIIAIIAVSGLVVLGSMAGYVYYKAFTANTTFVQKEVFVYIPTNATQDEVKEALSPFVKNWSKFEFVANKRNYFTNTKAGKFLLKQNMNSFDMVRALRSNIPVKVAFNNQESIEKFAQRLANQLEPDSTALMNAFTNKDFLSKNEIDRENVLSLFIPNSYEFYWNTSAEKLAEKLAKEYHVFWNDERKSKAANLNLTPQQVSVLASIVQKETAKVSERPRVAGVYLNRLATGMPLQADPTVIYAIKKQSGDFDQVIKRVLYDDLKIISPYNTYMNKGLPPGPIAMPDITALEAVLNPEKHSYIYFCASVERFGYHEFATTQAEHEQNAKKYYNWINSQGVKR